MISKLDYLEGMGITSIWLTPVFENIPTGPDASDALRNRADHITATGRWTGRTPIRTWEPTLSCKLTSTRPISAA